MPPGEIPWRVGEKAKKIIDGHRRFDNPDLFFEPNPAIYNLSGHATPEILDRFPEVMAYHRFVAENALKNKFISFGIETEHGREVNWFLDPVTGQTWPDEFWGRMSYRDTRYGGVKFVWEFNRLYFLFSLGLCYRVYKKRKYADCLLRIIHSWVTGNPYPAGINWSSGIECGVRLASLVWGLSCLKGFEMPDDAIKDINRFVFFNASRLFRYPSRYSSANNHLLAEGFGLFVAGAYFPGFKSSQKWLQKGKEILETQVQRQILPDGGSFEYSTTYLSFVLDFFILFRHSCQNLGMVYDAAIDRQIEKSCGFIDSLMDASGELPNMGDQDSAVLVDFGYSNMENFSSILNTGAVWFDMDQFCRPKNDLKTWMLTGKAATFKNRGKKVSHICHGYSGLGIIRDCVKNKEVFFTGNAMPLGLAPLYAHGHLDALSFTLSLDGLAFLIDPGTYQYHNAEKWRTYFRSTFAHNTIRLNQKEFSSQKGDFMFGEVYQVSGHKISKTEEYIIWEASHNAYMCRPPFAKVTRRVYWNVEKQLFQIHDKVGNQQSVSAELMFHCHPECRVSQIKDIIKIRRNGIGIDISNESGFKWEILKGCCNPVSGWFSPGFGEKRETVTIRFSGILNPGSEVLTALNIII